jgi:hypothetical protein
MTDFPVLRIEGTSPVHARVILGGVELSVLSLVLDMGNDRLTMATIKLEVIPDVTIPATVSDTPPPA